MTDQKAADPADPFELPADSTWQGAVQLFQTEAAGWLTPADAPQLMALRSIARQLDNGTFQAALISQFTLIHRALLARRPGDPAAPAGPAGSGEDLGLFSALGGVWRGDA